MFTDSGIAEDQAEEFTEAIQANDPDSQGPTGLKDIFNVYGEEKFRRDVLKGTFHINEVTKQTLFVSALKQYKADDGGAKSIEDIGSDNDTGGDVENGLKKKKP